MVRARRRRLPPPPIPRHHSLRLPPSRTRLRLPRPPHLPISQNRQSSPKTCPPLIRKHQVPTQRLLTKKLLTKKRPSKRLPTRELLTRRNPTLTPLANPSPQPWRLRFRRRSLKPTFLIAPPRPA